MLASILCLFVAQTGAGFLNPKPYYAGGELTTSVSGNLHYYGDDGQSLPLGEGEGVGADANHEALPPEPVEYVLTRTEVEDGVYNMSFLPLQDLVVVPGMEVAYANEDGDFVFPGEPDDLGGVNDIPGNPGITTIMHSLGNYQYQIRFGNWDANKWDVTSMKVTTTVPGPETYSYRTSKYDSMPSQRPSATYGEYFSYTTSSSSRSWTETVPWSDTDGSSDNEMEEYGIGDFINKVVNTVKETANKVVNKVTETVNKVVNAIKDTVNTVKDKITGGGSSSSRPSTPSGYYVTTTTVTTTYTYTGGGTTTISPSPNKSAIVKSFSSPTTSWSYSIKKHTLYIKDGLGRTNQVTKEYGSTYTVTKDSTTTGSYGTTSISSRNNQGFAYTGRYLSGWSKSGGGSFNGSTFTFTGSATLTANWSPLKYAIVWHDKEGDELPYANTGLLYGGSIGQIPIISPTPGYTGDFFMSGAKVTSSMIVNFSQSVMHAYYQEKARSIPIKWDANGGFFPDGGDINHTLTIFNQNYVMPPEVLRPGYVFDGWYTGSNPNSSSARKITSSSKFTNVNEDTMHARWKVKDNLTVKIFADEQLNSFNLTVIDTMNSTSNDYTWWQVQDFQNRFTNVYGCTEFVFSDMTFNNGWVFHNFSVKNTVTGLVATDGLDYKIEKSGDIYTIFAYESIEITINSCIRAEIKAVSNFNEGIYEVNQHGGLVSVNGGEYSKEAYVDVQYNDSIQLSAKKVGTNVEFLGYYSSFHPNTGVSGKKPLSPRGQLDWTSGGLKESGEIYAVFYFKHYEVNIYAFSSTKNFQDKTGLAVEDYDEIGGKVAVKHDNVNQEANTFSYSGHQSLIVADQYFYAVNVQTNTSTQARTEYRFVGFYDSIASLLADKTNSNPMPIQNLPLQKQKIDRRDVNLYAKFVLEYEFKVIAADEGGVSITLGDNSATKELKKTYYYGESIDRISTSIDSRYYEPASPAWKVISGSLLGINNQKNLNAVLNSQTIASGRIVMPDQPIEIKAQVVRKFFDLTVFAIYAEMDMYEFSFIAAITSAQ